MPEYAFYKCKMALNILHLKGRADSFLRLKYVQGKKTYLKANGHYTESRLSMARICAEMRKAPLFFGQKLWYTEQYCRRRPLGWILAAGAFSILSF